MNALGPASAAHSCVRVHDLKRALGVSGEWGLRTGVSYGPVRNTEKGEMEKIAQKTPNWAQVFMTAYLLWLTGATAQKVSDGKLIRIDPLTLAQFL